MTTRVIRRVEVIDEGAGNVRLDFHVQAALYKMVRNMAGLLISVGNGRLAPDDVPTLVASRDRSRLPSPAPAHGLTLEDVYYAEGWDGRYRHPLHPPNEADEVEEARVPGGGSAQIGVGESAEI